MTATWCSTCGRYVTAAAPCAHVGGTDDDAQHPARSGDDLLKGAARDLVPDGLNSEHAEMLRGSGDALGEKLVNRTQGLIRDEVWAVLDRLVRQSCVTRTDIVGVLTIIAHDVIHDARDAAEEPGA